MKKFLTLIAFFAINSLASAQILKDANLDANFLNHSVVPHNEVRASAVAAEANQVFNDIKLDMKSGDTWQEGTTRWYDIGRYLQGQPNQMGTSGNYYLTYDPHSRHIFSMFVSNQRATITTQDDALRKRGVLNYVPIDANLGDTTATNPWKSVVLFDTTVYRNAVTTNTHTWEYPTIIVTNPSKSANVEKVYVSFVTTQLMRQPGATRWTDQYRAFGFSTIKDLADGIKPPIALQLSPDENNNVQGQPKKSYSLNLKGTGASIGNKPYAFFYGDGYYANAPEGYGDYTYNYTLAAFNLENGDMEKSQNLPSKIMQQVFNNTIMVPNNRMWGTYAVDNDDNDNLYFAFNNALNANYTNSQFHNVFKQIKVPTVIKTKYVNDGELGLDFNDMVLDTLPLQVVVEYVNNNGGVTGDFNTEENHAWSFAYGPSADGRWDIAFNVIAEDEYSFFLPLKFNDGNQHFYHYVEVSSKNGNWKIRKIDEIQRPSTYFPYSWPGEMYHIAPPNYPVSTPVMYTSYNDNEPSFAGVNMRDLQLARTVDNQYYIAKWVACNHDDAVALPERINFKVDGWSDNSVQTFEVDTVYKSRILMSYRHINDDKWSEPVEAFKHNNLAMIRTFMPKVVSSVEEVPFTFFYAAMQGDPMQDALPFNFMKFSFWEYAYNCLVIGCARHGFVGIIEEGDAADAYSLGNAYPNPTSNEITFRFSLEQPAHTTLVITNTLGQTVATVVDQFCNGSDYTVKFDTGKLPIGTYYYTLTSGSRIETKMFTVVR